LHPEPPFWTWSVEQALARVGGSTDGLSSPEAVLRLRRRGPNELAPPRRFEALREIVRYLANPLVLILLVARGVSAAFGQVVSSVIVAVMLVLSVALNLCAVGAPPRPTVGEVRRRVDHFTQAYRSQKAALRLREQVGQTASGLRDGSPQELPTREVVPGDVIRLSAGDLVPADARLLSAKDLFLCGGGGRRVDVSLATGMSTASTISPIPARPRADAIPGSPCSASLSGVRGAGTGSAPERRRGSERRKQEEGHTMKRFLSVALVVAAVLVLAGEGLAQMAGPMRGPMHGPMAAGMGPGMMGGGMMGHGMMGGRVGASNCPGMAAVSGATESGAITEEKAKELAQQYADQNLKGFTVERVLPFTGRRGTMYSVELKGPDGQLRTFHVNPWGNVMPFGGPARRAG